MYPLDVLTFTLLSLTCVPLRLFCSVTNRPKKWSNTLIKAAAPNDQYQIDAGQKLIGPTECRKCGMVYDVGDPIDEKRHNTFHKTVTELKYKVSGEHCAMACGERKTYYRT